jgi:hypothetical protein
VHNDTDHQTQHPAAVVELVEPVAVVAVAAAAATERKPWSKDKMALPQVVSTSCLNLAITNGPHTKLKCKSVLCYETGEDTQSP